MKKWLVVKDFVLGEGNSTMRRLKGKNNDFVLAQNSIILESEVNDKVIINNQEFHFNIGDNFKKFCSLQEIIPESISASVCAGLPEANGFSWKNPSELEEVVPGKVFRTPEAFIPESLTIAIRGLMVAQENDDGFDIIDNQTFMLKEPLDTSQERNWLLVGYQKQ